MKKAIEKCTILEIKRVCTQMARIFFKGAKAHVQEVIMP
jgi:hypothetical protein